MPKKGKNNNMWKKSQLCIGSFLILLGVGIIFIKNWYLWINKNEEAKRIKSFYIQSEQIETVSETSSLNIDDNSVLKEENYEDYIAVIRIPKIGLEKGLYSKESHNNNLDKTIKILQESDYPDIWNGNFILAGHSGTGRNAYFNSLSKLEDGDFVYVDYNHVSYIYKIVYKYEVRKTGEVSIKRNTDKKTITMITCKNGTNKQIVIIGEIIKEEN